MEPPVPATTFRGPQMTERLLAWSIVSLAVIALFVAAKVASPIVAPTVLAGLFALTLSPLVTVAERRGIPGTLAAGLVVGSGVCVTASGAYLLAPSIDQWRLRAPSIVRSLERELRSIEREIKSEVGRATLGNEDKLAETSSAADAMIESSQRLITDAVLAAPEIVAMLLYIIFLCFFLLAERTELRRFVLSLAPTPSTRLKLSRAMRDMRQSVARYLLIISFNNAALGAAAALVFWLMELPNPALWGTMVAVLNFMPYIGPLTSNLLIFIVAVTTFHGVAAALYPVLALTGLNVLEGQVLTPMAIGRRQQVGPLAVFLSLAVGAWLWGVLGALVAAPLLIVGHAVTRRMFTRSAPTPRRGAAGCPAAG